MMDKEEALRCGPVPNYENATGGGARLACAIGHTSQADAAKILGISPAFLNHIIHGRKAPSLRCAIKIRDVYAVPVDLWCSRP